jgi:hypothetical protein
MTKSDDARHYRDMRGVKFAVMLDKNGRISL